MASMTFSVGIPTFNQAEYLPQTIDSLLKQTLPLDEIVISDHYSTDDTAEIIARYVAEHPGRIRGVRPPPGVNLTGQYSFTLDSQKADWISLLSSDDVARENFASVLMHGAASEQDAVLVRAGWENIDAAGKSMGKNYLVSVPKVERPPATLLSQRNGPRVSFAAFALKRTAYVESGPILPTLESLSDWALFVQMAPFGSFVNERELISEYRVGHDGDKFKRRLGMWVRDEQRMFAEVFPLAASRLQMTDTAWMAKASRDNFKRYLAGASSNLKMEDRAEMAEHFVPWAASVGAEDLLERFRQGERIEPPGALAQKMRAAVRPLAQELLGRLRR